MTQVAVLTDNGAVAIGKAQDFTAQQIDLIRKTVMDGASDIEFATFLNLCKAKRLDPLTRQIYAIKPRGGQYQTFASIDGLRVIAQRSGEYAGQVGPLWCGEDGKWVDVWLGHGKPAAAKVGVLRKGWPEPLWGVATFKSYGKDQGTWTKMPDVMLAKCAEAIALRKAFPDDLSALYVREEFDAPDSPEMPGNAPTAHVARPEPMPVTADVVDTQTGELHAPDTTAMRKRSLGITIKGLRERLNWDEGRVRQEALVQKLSLASVEGLTTMVGILEGYVAAAEAAESGVSADDDEEDYEGIEASQGTLLDADVTPLDRWA